MQYVATRRFKRDNALCGRVNIPYGAKLESSGGVLYYQGLPVCMTTGAAMRGNFAADDDGQGLVRGRLTAAIERRLASNRCLWQRVFDDAVCRKYEKAGSADFWLWSLAFYDAPIGDLKHIAALVGAEKG